jgi:regulator of replication initiation timing
MNTSRDECSLRSDLVALRAEFQISMSQKSEECEDLKNGASSVLDEIIALKTQNHELRAKIIRQDAAWKRKIDVERQKTSFGAHNLKSHPQRTPTIEVKHLQGPSQFNQNEKAWA